MNLLLLISITSVLGYIGGQLIAKIKIPKIVGYVIVGLILGRSLANLITITDAEKLSVITTVALSIMGFGIGCELDLTTLKKLGKSVVVITILEALGAFILVFSTISLLTKNIALGLVFGAISSATAAAGTIDVLQEYKASGQLTKTIYAVIGLDDALALIIYGFAAAIAKNLILQNVNTGALILLLEPFKEIIGSIVVGVVLGYILSVISKKLKSTEQTLFFALMWIFLCGGIANQFHFSLLLSNTVMGITVVNFNPTIANRLNRAMSDLNLTIFILFFILIGANLDVRLLLNLGLIGLFYILFRTIGKYGGAYLGGTFSRAPSKVRKNIGLALFSQSGVAMGLAILTAHEFIAYGESGKYIAQTVINVVTATTFIVQIIGPPFVKYAIVKAGEARLERT